MPLKPTTYATFVGFINQESAARAIGHMNAWSQSGVTELHVMVQSSGGVPGDAIAMYSYFRACPMALHFYNSGSIESAGVVAFVGAANRYVSAHGIFMIHKSTLTTPIPLKGEDMLARGRSLEIEDARYRAILQERTTIPTDCFANFDVTFVAQEAVNLGIAQGFREFVVPAGDPVLDLTFKLG